MEVAKRIGLQPVGWIFTDLVAQNSNGNGVVKHFRGTVVSSLCFYFLINKQFLFV